MKNIVKFNLGYELGLKYCIIYKDRLLLEEDIEPKLSDLSQYNVKNIDVCNYLTDEEYINLHIAYKIGKYPTIQSFINFIESISKTAKDLVLDKLSS